ncbi:MAG: hypothetical protein ACI9XO_003079 [Paraglaciecola sp.]|jgi:hypothetical protein
MAFFMVCFLHWIEREVVDNIYIEHLRRTTQLPIFYIGFDVESGEIFQEF